MHWITYKILFLIPLLVCGNPLSPILGLHDVFQRARNAIQLLELDSVYLNLPYGERDVNEVTFTLFTLKNPSNGQTLILNDSLSITSSNFDPLNPTKILIHGYTQSLTSLEFPQGIKNAYMKNKKLTKNYNTICVDWSVLSKEIIYFDSVNYTTMAGNKIGEFIYFLKSNGFIKNYQDIHLIGFSLGAHVAGVVGDYIIINQGLSKEIKKIGRITGLDPAGPGFTSVPRSQRLDRNDANFVDVIHSNMGSILLGDLGSTTFHGHADFYPNGGRRQPGCEYSVFSQYSIPKRSSCSHLKASEYYEKSILRENRYLGTKCNNWNDFQSGDCSSSSSSSDNQTEQSITNPYHGVITTIMGENCNPESRGKFYLHTT